MKESVSSRTQCLASVMVGVLDLGVRPLQHGSQRHARHGGGHGMFQDEGGQGGGGRGPRNVLGEPLQTCSTQPLTGFFRDGCCNTGPQDRGSHTVCALLTDAFLEFSKASGNDLSTPMPQYGFPGLKAGDRWCLCAPRWQEAFLAGAAPRVALKATHEGALAYCALVDLKAHGADLS